MLKMSEAVQDVAAFQRRGSAEYLSCQSWSTLPFVQDLAGPSGLMLNDACYQLIFG